MTPVSTARATTSVALVHLGCEKNLVDSERILGALAAEGHAVCQDPADAEVVIVNTCGFIEPAKKESIAAILRALDRKEAGTARAVVVAGCLAQRYAGDLRAEMPEVDAFVGLGDLARLREVCRAVAERAAIPDAPAPGGRALYPVGFEGDRLRLTPRHYAYLRIAEGCDHPCAFCAIPLMRGKNRSKPIEDLVREGRELVGDGARELVLIAQDTGSYGLDIYRRQALPDLIRALAEIPGLSWLRLMYLHPAMARPDLVELFGREERLLPYVDMPVQHGSDRLLREMRRGTTRDSIRRLADALRARDPHMTLRTTVLLGFPGETEEDVADLLALLGEIRFDRLGTFTYSREEGTPAFGMEAQVPRRTAEARRRRVMEAQAAIANERNRRRVGEETEARVDAVPARGPARARSYGEAPEVDGAVLLPRDGLAIGTEVRVRIEEASGYDLRGVPTGAATR
ncbi:MAG: 30S ribosomal protein S12 methylthiotransferase RimO [Planctomycetales bacterium]|nr:30S ribosomal protein S12 methylthiotransferase RimO [Planctomycetales bacterium]